MKKRGAIYRFDEEKQCYVEMTDEPAVLVGHKWYYDREESVVAYVEDLTGGLSAQAEAKLRAMLRRER